MTHFHISWPSRVDYNGEFVTHHLHARHVISSRQRRSTSEGLKSHQPYPNHLQKHAAASSPSLDAEGEHQHERQDPENVLHYKIPVHPEKDVMVELQNTHFLMGPAAVLEKVSSSGNVSDSLFTKLDRHHGCHLSGSVKGDLASKVALSACEGLVCICFK